MIHLNVLGQKPQPQTRREALIALGAGVAGASMLGLPSQAMAMGRRGNQGPPRWGMVIDLRRCIGCRGCTVSCKAEHDVPVGSFNCAVYQSEIGTYPNAKKAFLPVMCNHCTGEDGKEPPCVDVCPNKAMERAVFVDASGKKHRYRKGGTYQRPDGAILIDTEYCTGCGKCIEACPYGARWYHPHVKAPLDPSKQAVAKCNLCMHRVEKGLLPACVNTCQGKARIFGDLNDPKSEISRLVTEFGLEKNRKKTTLLSEEGTQPNVYYIDPNGVISAIKSGGKEFQDEVY